ncbi:MAG: amylo-alpha-1,6-glucosidase [Terriglobia bacterium]
MEDVIRVTDDYYIRATSALADDRTRVLKDNDIAAVLDRRGDIEAIGISKHGLFLDDTRFLSRFVFRLEGERPQLLSSNIKEEDTLLTVDLTNMDISMDGQVAVPRETLHVFRSMFLWQNACYERLRFLNYSLSAVEIEFSFQIAADFADMFEVRGMKRERKGQRLDDQIGPDGIVFSYVGLDGLLRRTRINCFPRPLSSSSSELKFRAALGPGTEQFFFLTVSCESSRDASQPLLYDEAFAGRKASLQASKRHACVIDTSNEDVNEWLNRSDADLHLMITNTSFGPYPFAGLPWFNAPFGRDGIITALEALWMAPWIGKGVLAYLAASQAQEVIPEADAEPGKILHESRQGEMARLKEVPFARYYGSVDATPLFVMLAAAYYERTADRDFIATIWSSVDLALQWIDDFGDLDGDGFVEYKRQSSTGLEQQGWKDSSDSIFHADGALVDGPVALCEVQGYVYAAKRGAATLASALGMPGRAKALERQAQTLQERFENSFWCEDLATYALALDGRKRPCQVRTSNAGHCLFTEIASRDHAQQVEQMLLGNEFFSGWGIRTLGSAEVRYNPMSYHNGSVWPHDNALIAWGLARYGFMESTLKVAAALFDVSRFVDLHRLPELFCGFTRRPAEGPTLYPVACAPQSWAVASVFLLVQMCLGISVTGSPPEIRFTRPVLPNAVEYVEMRDLKVGEASVDLTIEHDGDGVSVNPLRKQGDIKITVSDS